MVGRRWVTIGLAVAVTLTLVPARAGAVPLRRQISGDSHSYEGGVSGDGRYVVFSSWAANLVSGDTNQTQDVFVRDLVAGTTGRVDVSGSGAQANGASFSPSISADGRYVAFVSGADNLVAGDTNGTWDVFVRDLVGGSTQRASVATGGTQANGMSYDPAISADGQSIAFTSTASNLATGDTNGDWDVFVRSRSAGTTRLASATAAGVIGNHLSYDASLSANGRYITFVSAADNLITADTNGSSDVLVRDLTTGAVSLVSVAASGGPADAPSVSPQITPDGRYVAYTSIASNLVAGDTNAGPDVFVRDRTLGSTRRIDLTPAGNQPNGAAFMPFISDDGRYLTFASTATDLVPPAGAQADAQVFSRDLTTGAYRQASLSPAGQGAGQPANVTGTSPDGRFIAYQTASANLDTTDTNDRFDIYLWDRQTGTSRRASLGDGATARVTRPRPPVAAPVPAGAGAGVSRAIRPAAGKARKPGAAGPAGPVRPQVWAWVARVIIVWSFPLIRWILVWVVDQVCAWWDTFHGWVGGL